MEKELYEKIAKVAYDLYEKKGRIDGSHFENWLEAEKIVMAGQSEDQVQEAGIKKVQAKAVSEASAKKKVKTAAKTKEPKSTAPKAKKAVAKKKTVKE